MAKTRAQGLHIPYPNQLEGRVRVILLPKPHWSVEEFKKWIKTCCHLLEQLHVNWHCQFQTLGTLAYWPLYKRRCGDYRKNADENFLPVTISVETVCKFHMRGVLQSFQNQSLDSCSEHQLSPFFFVVVVVMSLTEQWVSLCLCFKIVLNFSLKLLSEKKCITVQHLLHPMMTFLLAGLWV